MMFATTTHEAYRGVADEVEAKKKEAKKRRQKKEARKKRQKKGAVQGEVSSTAINNGLFSLVRSGPRDDLWCTTGSGAKVTTGTISLSSHSCIVFDDTCSGMHLSDLTICSAPPAPPPTLGSLASGLIEFHGY
jgi:hypothetical protein